MRRFNGSAFGTFKSIIDNIHQFVPIPTACDIRRDAEQQGLRRHGIGLIVVKCDACGFLRSRYFLRPIVEQNAALIGGR